MIKSYILVPLDEVNDEISSINNELKIYKSLKNVTNYNTNKLAFLTYLTSGMYKQINIEEDEIEDKRFENMYPVANGS